MLIGTEAPPLTLQERTVQLIEGWLNGITPDRGYYTDLAGRVTRGNVVRLQREPPWLGMIVGLENVTNASGGKYQCMFGLTLEFVVAIPAGDPAAQVIGGATVADIQLCMGGAGAAATAVPDLPANREYQVTWPTWPAGVLAPCKFHWLEMTSEVDYNPDAGDDDRLSGAISYEVTYYRSIASPFLH